jgi:serine/threonine-protein kinase RsbW
MRFQVSLTLPREAVSVPLVRHLVGATLERAGVTAACVQEVKVALSEACTNAYEHAVGGENYEVVVTLDDETVAIDVLDRGAGIPSAAVDLPVPDVDQSVPGSSLPEETGRGIDLIQALTEGARFDTTVDGHGGAVHMWKRLDWEHGAAPWSAPLRPPGDGA